MQRTEELVRYRIQWKYSVVSRDESITSSLVDVIRKGIFAHFQPGVNIVSLSPVYLPCVDSMRALDLCDHDLAQILGKQPWQRIRVWVQPHGTVHHHLFVSLSSRKTERIKVTSRGDDLWEITLTTSRMDPVLSVWFLKKNFGKLFLK